MKKQGHVNFAMPTKKGVSNWLEYTDSHGTVSTCFWRIVTLVGTVASVILWFFSSSKEPGLSIFPHLFYYVGVPTATIGFIGFLYINIRYFKRNVIGYELWLYHEKCCDEPLHEEQHARVILRGEPMSVKHSAVIISLGGWFTRKVRVNRATEYGRGWNIDPRFLKNCKGHNVPSQSEVLIRTHDEAMRVDINTLIGFMDHVIKESTYVPAWPYNFGDAFMRYYRMAVNDGRDLEVCLNALYSVAGRILDTKRFGKSKDAARIRADIIDTLKQVLPPGDSRLPKTEATSSDAA